MVTASCPDAESLTRDDVRESSSPVFCHAVCHRDLRPGHLCRRRRDQPPGRRRLWRHRLAELSPIKNRELARAGTEPKARRDLSDSLHAI
ncbi:hypothetical protein MPL3356_300039 [Mesorhizobium plurifarium]|uniref:Uncharacterized protein n=1 Tax=Mesorhizobium plurifarium TaxID=69974 RepID=A0A090DYP6_MESPL|nr:hypothetical protein MPL3356_300039 [Mesorhizobium plurifarium]